VVYAAKLPVRINLKSFSFNVSNPSNPPTLQILTKICPQTTESPASPVTHTLRYDIVVQIYYQTASLTV
jgi:hypothetical protein